MGSTNHSSLLLISSLLFSAVAAVQIIEKNHDEVTVRVGDEATLVCISSHEYKVCNFKGPKTEIMPIFPDVNYEAGRITGHIINPQDCGIRIKGVTDSDQGKWECSITASADGSYTTVKGDINVTVAVAPRAVSLRVDGEPMTSKVLRVKLDESGPRKIDCVAEGARPRPVFKWFIGSSEYSGHKTATEDGDSYIETLDYFPDPSHNDQTLRCMVEHMGYLPQDIEQKYNIVDVKLELHFRPQQSPKAVQEFYELREGESNKIVMSFKANPRPTEAIWTINGVEVPAADSRDGKYQSSEIESGDLSGDYTVTLTINDLKKEDVGRENELKITNEEGSTTYKFIMEIGSKPPAASATGPIVGIVILVLILIFLIGFAVFARMKGILCFAVKRKQKSEDTEKAVDREGSDTESAEDHAAAAAAASPTATSATAAGDQPESEVAVAGQDTIDADKPKGPAAMAAAKFSNLFSAVKKSVASRGVGGSGNPKDKYAANGNNEQAE